MTAQPQDATATRDETFRVVRRHLGFLRGEDPLPPEKSLRELGLDDIRTTRTSAVGKLGRVPREKIVAACVHEGIPVLGFSVESPSLEDVFVSLTGEGFDVGS